MSKYMEMKVEIERMQAQLERVRQEELEEVVVDMRKQIIAWGVTPEMLFPGLTVASLRKVRVDGSHTAPPKYAWQGRHWSGVRPSRPPLWYSAALTNGVTPQQMEAECVRLRESGELKHAAWGN